MKGQDAFQHQNAVKNVALEKIPCCHIHLHIIEVNQVQQKVNNSTIWEKNYYPETAFSIRKFSSVHLAVLFPWDFFNML